MCWRGLPRLLEELFQVATGEKRQEHPNQRMFTIRPEKGHYPPHHHKIDNRGRDDQHDSEKTRVAKPSHGVSLLYDAPVRAELKYS